MTGSEIAQIITSFAALIGALGSIAAVIQSSRNGRVLMDVKTQTDGINSKLVETTAKFASAEGTAAGIVEGHAAGLEQGRKEERK